MSEDNEALYYQQIPQSKLQAKVLTNWTANDLLVLVASFLVVIITWIYLGIFAALCAMLILLPLSFRFPKGYSRMYGEIASEIKSMYFDTVLKGVLWDVNDTSGWLLRRLRRHPPIPLRLIRIQSKVRGRLERYGLIEQLDRPYIHLLIAADGGAFASMDARRQAMAVQQLAAIKNQVILQSDLTVGTSYVRMTSPFDASTIASLFRTNMNPVIAQPELFDLDSKTQDWAAWMRQNASELQGAASQAGAADVWSLIVVTIKRSRELRNTKKSRLSDEQLNQLPIIELGRALVDALAADTALELRNVRCLSLPEVSDVVRSSWDIQGIAGYQRDKSQGKVPLTDEAVDELRANPGAPDFAASYTWPLNFVMVSKKDNYIRLNDNYLSTLRVVKLPDQIRSDQFLSLQYLAPFGAWTRLAMVGQSVSGNMETNQLIISGSALMNLQSAFFKDRVIQHPKFARKQRELASQTQQISANTVAQHFNMLCVVAAGSEDELLRRRKQVRSALSAHGFQCEVVIGSARQLDAAISGMLGVNRM